MNESFEGEKFVMGREGGDYYSGVYVDWLEVELEAMKQERRILVDVFKENMNGGGGPMRDLFHQLTDETLLMFEFGENWQKWLELTERLAVIQAIES